MAISWLCLALATVQVLIIVPRMYSDRPTSVTLVCLFNGAVAEALFGVFTLVHLRLLGSEALPAADTAGFNRPSGAYTYVFFWLIIPIAMVLALVAGLSDAHEAGLFDLQVICLVLTFVWPFMFRRMFVR